MTIQDLKRRALNARINACKKKLNAPTGESSPFALREASRLLSDLQRIVNKGDTRI